MKNELNNIAIRLNRYRSARFVFKLLCKLQLLIIKLCFKTNKNFVALIVRRKNSLNDFYAGNSDYDITCIVDAERLLYTTVRYYAVLYRILKKILFPLGEIKIIGMNDFPQHMHYNWVNYGDYPLLYFLYKKNGLLLNHNPANAKNICVYHKIYQLFFSYILSALYTRSGDYANEGLIFSRNLCKNAKKIRKLVNFLKGEECTSLDYNTLSEKEVNFMLSEKERNSIVNECAMTIKQELPTVKHDDNFTFTVKGKLNLLDTKIISRLNTILQPFILQHHPAIAEFFICNYRLYKTSKVIILGLKDNLTEEAKHSLRESIKGICGQLSVFDDILVKPFPIIFNNISRKEFTSAEQISYILSECIKYDFLSQKISNSSDKNFSINKDFIYTDIEEALDLVNSVVRNRNPLYLLELIFGHLMAYNDLLETGVLQLSFDNLYDKLLKDKCNIAQNRIIDLYRMENYNNLNKIDSLKIWKIFEDIIKLESAKSCLFLRKATAVF